MVMKSQNNWKPETRAIAKTRSDPNPKMENIQI